MADISALEQSLGIPPGLYAALIRRGEASGETATSPKGAYGRAQLMPGTASDMGVDARDPDQNLYGGAKYLKAMLNRYHGDTTRAVEAYNEGPGRVDRGVVYPEAASYVRRVTGANVVPNTGADTSAGDLSPFLAQILAGSKPDATEQALFKRSQEASAGAQDFMKGEIPELEKIKHGLGRPAPVGPDAPQYPTEKSFQDRELGKVSNQPNDPSRVLMQYLPMIAILGGAFAHKGSTAALDAATAAMTAAKGNDKAATEKAHQEFMDTMTQMRDQYEGYRQRYEDERQKYGDDKNSLIAQQSVMAAERGDKLGMETLATGDWSKYHQMRTAENTAWEKVIPIIQHHQDHMDALEGKRQVLQDSDGTSYVYDMRTHQATTLNGDPYTPTSAKHIESGRPTSMQSEALKAFKKENPNANSDDISRFAMEFGAKTTAAKAFATGKQGDTVRSLNVSVSHLQTLRALGEALQNGDVRLINEAKQRFAEEFGVPAPTNFDTAKSIVADEVAKGVIGGATAQNDRETLAASLRRSGSPQSINGAIDTFQKLLGGQLGGLQHQYEHSTGEKNFGEFLLPETKKALGIKDEGAEGGGEHALSDTLKSQYDSIKDPAKKATAKQRLESAGYEVP